jgi:hypothetical protein
VAVISVSSLSVFPPWFTIQAARVPARASAEMPAPVLVPSAPQVGPREPVSGATRPVRTFHTTMRLQACEKRPETSMGDARPVGRKALDGSAGRQRVPGPDGGRGGGHERRDGGERGDHAPDAVHAESMEELVDDGATSHELPTDY